MGRISAIIFVLSWIQLTAFSQFHDFDSLRKANSDFQRMIDSIGDTTDLFNVQNVLEMTLETDLKNLIKRKYKNEYQPAKIKLMFSDSVMLTKSIKLRPRGNMRKSTCFVPPLKLKFPEKSSHLKQLQEFDKLKMVMDCKRGSVFEQYLLLEYFAYKLQNILTEYSLRVRLLKVKYTDTSGKFKEITRYAFFIENINQLAERKNALRIETKGIGDLKTERAVLADVYLFQYLIGNTDWSIPNLHNIYLIKSKDPNKLNPIVVPYDFDYAGIVNTTYAVPDELLGTASVRERVYRGVCLTKNEMMQSRQRYLSKKDQVYQVFEEQDLLTSYNANEAVRYIDEFYSILENERIFQRYIVDNCR